jgi:3-oxoacyl-[acyl-carrier-protein] synthase-3
VPVSEHPLHDVCAKLGIDNALAFTLTQHACASGLLGVDLAGKLLADDGDPDALALVFTGEKAFTRGTQLLPGVTIMGEAAAACLVSASGERDKLLGYATLIAGEYYDQVDDPDEGFARRYPELLGDVLEEAVARAGLSWPEIALVLPHNVNRVSWVKIGKRLGVPLDRLYLDEVPKTGHCFAADSFVNQVSARAAGRLREGDAYVMAAAGLGAVCSAMVFRH